MENAKTSAGNNLKLQTTIGYAIGAVSEGIGYNVFFSFFIFFMTTIAGVRPSIAGAVSLIAVLWDAVTDPMVGSWSDNTRNKRGRRRPFIMIGSVGAGVSMALLFYNANMTGDAKAVYYILVNIAFWAFLTCCVIPHIALGSELTDDYDGRTKLRAYATFLMGVGTMAATSGPLMLVKLFTGVFGSDDMGWFGMGVTYGVLIVVFYHICCLALRSQEPPNPNLTKGLAGEKISFASVLAGYKKAFSNRALVCLVVITFVVNVVVTYGASLQMYLLTYVYGYDEMKTSSIFFIQSVFVLAAVVVATFLAKKLGKKYAMIVGQIIYGVSFLWVLLFPVSYATMISSIALLAIGNSAYWTLIYSMTYDSTLIEQYKSGEVPSGLYVSMIGFFMKVGNSLGMFFSGLSLEYIGFQGDAAEQAASTVRGIRMMFGIVPAFVFVIGIIAGFKYALTKEKYDLLNNALQLKQQNRPHDVDGLRGIL